MMFLFLKLQEGERQQNGRLPVSINVGQSNALMQHSACFCGWSQDVHICSNKMFVVTVALRLFFKKKLSMGRYMNDLQMFYLTALGMYVLVC